MSVEGDTVTSGENQALKNVVAGLMMSENMGDVHDEIIILCGVLGETPPGGGFIDGWDDGEFGRFFSDR